MSNGKSKAIEEHNRKYYPIIFVIILVAIAYWLVARFGLLEPKIEFVPTRAADAKGLIDRWDTKDDKIHLVLEQDDGTFKKVVLSFNDNSQILFASSRDKESRTYARAQIADVQDGLYAAVYMEKFGLRHSGRFVETFVYWK
jgi:hypothetical protein